MISYVTDDPFIKKVLGDKGWIYCELKECDLIFRVRSANRMKSKINETIITKIFYDKYHLFKYLNKCQYPFMPKTYTDIGDVDVINGNWFYKISNSSGGYGVKIISSYDELVSVLEKKYGNYVIQKQIDNPLLYQGRKFDLRVYLTLNTNGNGYMYKIFGARINKCKYNNESKSRKIQLTNVAQGAQIIPTSNLPDELSDLIYNSVFKSVLYLFKSLPRLQKTDELGFSFLGADFIIDEYGKAWLLEINHRPGLGNSANKEWYMTQYIMMDEFMEYIIKSYLKKQERPNKTGNWIFVTNISKN